MTEPETQLEPSHAAVTPPAADPAARIAELERERDGLREALAAARAAASPRTEDDLLRHAFFAMASHELRTPLQSLALQVGVMLTRVRGTADEIPASWIVGRLTRTQAVVDRMRRLVEGLLNLSEIASGRIDLKRDRVDLADVAASVVSGARDTLEWAGCPCELELEAGVTGQWDRLRLEIMLDNLLSNAVKYAPGKPITVRVRRDGAGARLEVRDRGPGVAPADRERVFRRFERVEGSAKVAGFGLGLWIVATLAAAHGGEARVEGAPGAGATFVVTLPT